jgi:hypothetical protein
MSDDQATTAQAIAALVLKDLKPVLTEIAGQLTGINAGVGNLLVRVTDLEAVDIKNELAKLNMALFEHMKKADDLGGRVVDRVVKLEEWKERGGGDERDTELVEEAL